MVNVYDYFAINWEATAENIKCLMSTRVSNKVLANFMCVDERTIRNWYNCTSKPDIDVLVLIAKICDVDLLDILVLNGQISDCISKEDLNECIEKVEQTWDDNDIKEKDTEFDYINEQMLIRGIVINEYRKQNYPITNLDEFLLILPLVNLNKLRDILYRVNGNIGTNKDYVLEQLMKLYDNIPNDKAKEFVEYYKEYYLNYPSVISVTDFTTMDLKLKKFKEVINIYESERYVEMCKSYQEKYDTFLELLLLASRKNDY